MHNPIRSVLARTSAHRRRVLRIQNDIIIIDIITRMNIGARDSRHHALTGINIPSKVHKSNVGDTHQTCPAIRANIPAILVDRWASTSVLGVKIREQDITHAVPAATAGKTGALVGGLRNLRSNPRLDVCAVVHVLIVPDDFDVVEEDVGHAAVVEVLAKTADGDTIAVSAGYVCGCRRCMNGA